MKLKRNREITIKSWLNETVISDENWEVYSEEIDDSVFIFAKDPTTGNQLKIKMEKITSELPKEESKDDLKDEVNGFQEQSTEETKE